MILVDSNLLIYASTECRQQPAATSWLDSVMSGHIRIGIPWQSLVAFIRVVTNRRLYRNPLRMEEATGEVERWLGLPNVWVPAPGPDHLRYLSRALMYISNDAGVVTAAHLAALGYEYGLTIYSADSDFARFDGLKWVNPLKTSSPDKN